MRDIEQPGRSRVPKTAVKASSRMGLDQGIEYEAELFIKLYATKNNCEGIDAFFKDREPELTGV
jgi:enoyl-CoA hydratase